MSTSKSGRSAEHHRPAQPKYRRSRTFYVDDNYVDEHGNRWIVRISGETDTVRAMIEKGHIALDAEPIDEHALKQIAEELRAKDREKRSDRAQIRELPSLETHALFFRSEEHPYWRIHYEIIVPHAGNSWHYHSVDVGGDSLARVTFSADLSSIDVYMGGASASGLSGEVRWQTNNASIALSVYENGTGYSFRGDTVTPPGG